MEIIPAILTNNQDELIFKLAAVEKFARSVQLDIMDGQFVPQTSVDLTKLNLTTTLSLEVHLMVADPHRYLAACQTLAAVRVFVHLEAVANIDNFLEGSLLYNFEIGLAVSPQTPVDQVFPYLAQVERVLLLGVEPGRQGQEFIASTLDKITLFKKYYPYVWLEVDGGVKDSNIKDIKERGADAVAVGSFIMQADDMAAAYAQLDKLANH